MELRDIIAPILTAGLSTISLVLPISFIIKYIREQREDLRIVSDYSGIPIRDLNKKHARKALWFLLNDAGVKDVLGGHVLERKSQIPEINSAYRRAQNLEEAELARLRRQAEIAFNAGNPYYHLYVAALHNKGEILSKAFFRDPEIQAYLTT